MVTVVISPVNVVNFPDGGGHFWVYMQYVQGLHQLGCEVYWLERFCSSGDQGHDALMLSTFTQRMECYAIAHTQRSIDPGFLGAAAVIQRCFDAMSIGRPAGCWGKGAGNYWPEFVGARSVMAKSTVFQPLTKANMRYVSCAR
jgi:hypothetical protein